MSEPTIPMISDDKRREVAAKLRNNLKYMRANEKWYEYDIDSEKCGNRAYRTIAASVEESGNFVNGNYIHIVETLADLIYQTCSMSDIGDDTEQIYRCSSCGEEYCMSDVKPYPWRFCPNCGARVVMEND